MTTQIDTTDDNGKHTLSALGGFVTCPAASSPEPTTPVMWRVGFKPAEPFTPGATGWCGGCDEVVVRVGNRIDNGVDGWGWFEA